MPYCNASEKLQWASQRELIKKKKKNFMVIQWDIGETVAKVSDEDYLCNTHWAQRPQEVGQTS